MVADQQGGSRSQQKKNLLILWHRKLVVCEGTRTGETLPGHFHQLPPVECHVLVPALLNSSSHHEPVDDGLSY